MWAGMEGRWGEEEADTIRAIVGIPGAKVIILHPPLSWPLPSPSRSTPQTFKGWMGLVVPTLSYQAFGEGKVPPDLTLEL